MSCVSFFGDKYFCFSFIPSSLLKMGWDGNDFTHSGK